MISGSWEYYFIIKLWVEIYYYYYFIFGSISLISNYPPVVKGTSPNTPMTINSIEVPNCYMTLF